MDSTSKGLPAGSDTDALPAAGRQGLPEGPTEIGGITGKPPKPKRVGMEDPLAIVETPGFRYRDDGVHPDWNPETYFAADDSWLFGGPSGGRGGDLKDATEPNSPASPMHEASVPMD